MTYRPEDRRDHPETYRVPTEEDVPNEAKPLPTARNSVYVLCAVVALLAILAVTVMIAGDWEVIGLILSVVAIVLGIVGIVMARGDARVSITMPVVATFCAALIGLFIFLDFGEADDLLEGEGPNAIVGVDDDQIPDDPADLADVDNDVQPAGAVVEPEDDVDGVIVVEPE